MSFLIIDQRAWQLRKHYVKKKKTKIGTGTKTRIKTVFTWHGILKRDRDYYYYHYYYPKPQEAGGTSLTVFGTLAFLLLSWRKPWFSFLSRGVFLPPQYCGVGTGQHMYINAFEGLDVSIKDPNPRLQDEKMIFQQVQSTIDITIGSASAEGRKWSIRSP